MKTFVLAVVVVSSLVILYLALVMWAMTGAALGGGKTKEGMFLAIIVLMNLINLITAIISYFLMNKRPIFNKFFIGSFIVIIIEIGFILTLFV